MFFKKISYYFKHISPQSQMFVFVFCIVDKLPEQMVRFNPSVSSVLLTSV